MADETKIVEAEGRKFHVRPLDPGDTLDLLEAAGDRAGKRGWMLYASRACSVRQIDEVPVPMPTDVDSIKALARRIGNAGMAALMADLVEPASEGAAAEADPEQEAAKN